MKRTNLDVLVDHLMSLNIIDHRQWKERRKLFSYDWTFLSSFLFFFFFSFLSFLDATASSYSSRHSSSCRRPSKNVRCRFVSVSRSKRKRWKKTFFFSFCSRYSRSRENRFDPFEKTSPIISNRNSSNSTNNTNVRHFRQSSQSFGRTRSNVKRRKHSKSKIFFNIFNFSRRSMTNERSIRVSNVNKRFLWFLSMFFNEFSFFFNILKIVRDSTTNFFSIYFKINSNSWKSSPNGNKKNFFK